jgi:hypothetical protein
MFPSRECIRFLTNHQYLKNPPLSSFLESCNYNIQLDNYICYCVGVIDYQRIINCIRITKKTPTEKITTMHIEWFNPQSPYSEKIEFWVNSGVCLKRLFFLYEDQLNFFRSTFIYSETTNQYYRLANLLNFIQLPEINPTGEKIYNSPMKKYIYKKMITSNPEKINEKRKKEVRKSFMNILKRHNMDGFVEKNFKSMYVEIEKLM